MSGPLFYVDDEGPRRHYSTLAEALDDANLQISICRENCDPEWPMETGDICIYRCEAETEEPNADGKLVMQATEVNVREPDDDDPSGVEYWCDFEMRPRGGDA